MERTTEIAEAALRQLTSDWGTQDAVDLYLGRCQVDTPSDIVEQVWRLVAQHRKHVKKVVDFGAGDGRFAGHGSYEEYVGYEIDLGRCRTFSSQRHARLLNKCAFSESHGDADLCIGNPPYVRNQDLPDGWRQQASRVLQTRTGVSLSGLSNAWQYFFLLALASTLPNGLVALVIPYEWVSRPSARQLREYIRARGWAVRVYRLHDDTFSEVLTTASVTIVDKRVTDGTWKYFDQVSPGQFAEMDSPSGGPEGVIPHLSLRGSIGSRKNVVRAKRGLSPGTQKVLTLTEGERVHSGLWINADVVPCVTSLRRFTGDGVVLSDATFRRFFRDAGEKCWLIRTDKHPSGRLMDYLRQIPASEYQTATCLSRDTWWKFSMPEVPSVLVASGFRQVRPKVVVNEVGARAVGGVLGVYGLGVGAARKVVRAFSEVDLSSSVVAHSNGLRKVEVNQLNTLLSRLTKDAGVRK